MFGPSDLGSGLNFLATFKQTCDSDFIYKSTAICYAIHFMTKPAAASFRERFHLKNNKSSDKLEGRLSFWKEVVKHPPETCPTDKVIYETEIHMKKIKNFGKHDVKRLHIDPMDEAFKMQPGVYRIILE